MRASDVRQARGEGGGGLDRRQPRLVAATDRDQHHEAAIILPLLHVQQTLSRLEPTPPSHSNPRTTPGTALRVRVASCAPATP